MKLKENEKIIKVLKPHPFTRILLWGMMWLCILILGGIYFLLWDFSYKILFLIGWLQITILIFYYLVVYFELSVVIVTNIRMIYVKSIYIFQHHYEDIDFLQIKTIKAEQKWLFPNFFWYGTLIIHTSSWEKISFPYVKNTLWEAKEFIKIIQEKV